MEPGTIGESTRTVRVVASRIDLEDVSGRVLFPSMAQGPWTPFLRFAETVATGGGIDPEGHPHRDEEVLTYVLDGEVDHEDAEGSRTVLGAGSAVLFAARSETRHNLVAHPGSRARWLSVVIRLPGGDVGPDHRVQFAPAPLPAGEKPGARERRVVGPGAALVASSALECTELELRANVRHTWSIGRGRRAVVYVLDGRATIDEQPVEISSGALLENATAVSLNTESGARLIVASAPVK